MEEEQKQDEKTRQQRAYEAYAASTGGLTYDGRLMPTWHELPSRIQDAWKAAALAIS